MTRVGTAVIFAALLLGACAETPPPPEDHFYRLDVRAAEVPRAAKRLPGVTMVERLGAVGITGGTALLYSPGDQIRSVKEYHYHHWAEPPGVLLQNRLIDFVRRSGLGETVVTPDMRTEADYAVSGRILRLERVIGAEPTVSVKLELGLRSERDGRVMAVKVYELSLRHNTDSVAEAVGAINVAVDRIFAQFIRDVTG